MKKLVVAFGLLLNFNWCGNRHTNQNNNWNDCPDQFCFSAFMKISAIYTPNAYEVINRVARMAE
jgi:hypothetical protein